MKRFFFALGLMIVCTACSSTSGDRSTVMCDQQFWNGKVSVCLPDAWKVVDEPALTTLGVSEEVVAAFQSTTPRAGQFDTVTLVREVLDQDLKTADYSEASILAVSTLPEYKLLDKQSALIDGEQASLHIFSARASAEKPVRRYYQVSAVHERVGYTATASFPLAIKDADASQVEFILKNISLVDPSAKKTE